MKAINTAVDLIVAHFGTSRDPGVKVCLAFNIVERMKKDWLSLLFQCKNTVSHEGSSTKNKPEEGDGATEQQESSLLQLLLPDTERVHGFKGWSEKQREGKFIEVC